MDDYTYELMRAMQDFNIKRAEGLIEHSQYSEDPIYKLDLQQAIDYVNQKEKEYKNTKAKMERIELTTPHRVKIGVPEKFTQETQDLKAFKSFLESLMLSEMLPKAIPADEAPEVQPIGDAAEIHEAA